MKLARTATIIIASLVLMGCAALGLSKATHKVIVNERDFTSPVSVMIPIDMPNFFEAPYTFDNIVPFTNEVAACVYRSTENTDDVYVIGLVVLGVIIEPYALYYGEQFFIFPDFEGPPVLVDRDTFEAYHSEILELSRESIVTPL